MSQNGKVIPMSDGSKQISPEVLAPTILPDAYHTSDIARAFIAFHMPRYNELPAMPLYRDQIITYIDDLLHPLDDCVDGPWLSPSMINNYVKMGLISPPIKKQYGRTQIARLIAICLFKQILPIAAIQSIFKIQSVSYNADTAFDYVATELESALHAAFSLDQQGAPDSAHRITRESLLVRSGITAFVSKAYLMGYLRFTHL